MAVRYLNKGMTLIIGVESLPAVVDGFPHPRTSWLYGFYYMWFTKSTNTMACVLNNDRLQLWLLSAGSTLRWYHEFLSHSESNGHFSIEACGILVSWAKYGSMR